MSRIIVAFDSEEMTQRVNAILIAASLSPRYCCRTGAEVIRQVRYMGGGVVICPAKLKDMTADTLYDDLDGGACILVLGRPQQLEICTHPRIFRLALPVSPYDLSASVNILLQLDEMQSGQPRRTGEDQRLIDQAKALLCRQGMTEAEAHRYLQQRSMNRQMRKVDFARLIIETYGKEG